SNFRVEDLARDIAKLASADDPDDRRAREELEQSVARLRECAQGFFVELAFAHRGAGRVKTEERVRAASDSLAPARETAALVSGALEALESLLVDRATARPRSDAGDDEDDSVGGVPLRPGREAADGHGLDEQAAALARRAGEIRDELRILLRADDDGYVHFVE